ncbi:MAG: class I SAM-dependent methyltransferase [Zetaproteobacteria bacterium]|nr:MAG: class I SAM-dependent methyltransferase [Zetaproteobacteria bacterium]
MDGPFAIPSDMTVLDIGCGFSKQPGAIGIDRIEGCRADVLGDVACGGLPFRDDTFDAIYCNDVLEHVPDVIEVVEEIWRVGRPGADLFIVSPSMSSVHLHTDPTHRRAFTSRSFDYFVEGEKLFKYGYSHARFRKVAVVYDRASRRERRFYDRWMADFATRHPLLYESRLAYIFPLQDISFHLQVVK